MNELRLSIGEYTTPGLSFAEDLAVYRAAGAEGIGIDVGLKVKNYTEDLARFRESGLTATFCFPETSTVFAGSLSRTSKDPHVRIEEMCAGVRALAAFDPVCCACGPGPYGDRDRGEARKLAVAGLKQAALTAAELGLKIAIEPLHSSMEADWSFITNIPDALDLIDDVDEPNVGLIVDVWHLWDTPDVVAHIVRAMPRILGVHVNDHRAPTRSWCDRVRPGDGIGDVEGILGALDYGGYDGWIEVEIFSDDGRFGNEFPDSLWALNPRELVETALESTRRAWERRRLPEAGAV